jgi:hypothetical protein
MEGGRAGRGPIKARKYGKNEKEEREKQERRSETMRTKEGRMKEEKGELRSSIEVQGEKSSRTRAQRTDDRRQAFCWSARAGLLLCFSTFHRD